MCRQQSDWFRGQPPTLPVRCISCVRPPQVLRETSSWLRATLVWRRANSARERSASASAPLPTFAKSVFKPTSFPLRQVIGRQPIKRLTICRHLDDESGVQGSFNKTRERQLYVANGNIVEISRFSRIFCPHMARSRSFNRG